MTSPVPDHIRLLIFLHIELLIKSCLCTLCSLSTGSNVCFLLLSPLGMVSLWPAGKLSKMTKKLEAFLGSCHVHLVSWEQRILGWIESPGSSRIWGIRVRELKPGFDLGTAPWIHVRNQEPCADGGRDAGKSVLPLPLLLLLILPLHPQRKLKLLNLRLQNSFSRCPLTQPNSSTTLKQKLTASLTGLEASFVAPSLISPDTPSHASWGHNFHECWIQYFGYVFFTNCY